MRHLKAKIRLTRNSAHRNAIIINIAKALIKHKRISTTFGKAKASQSFIERLITYAKRGGLNSYRLIEKAIHDKRLAKRVVDIIAPNYKDRNGGYTRIIKAEPRQGDSALMVVFEFVGDYKLEKYLGWQRKAKVKEVKAETKEGAKTAETKEIKTEEKKEAPKKRVVKKVKAAESKKEEKK